MALADHQIVGVTRASSRLSVVTIARIAIRLKKSGHSSCQKAVNTGATWSDWSTCRATAPLARRWKKVSGSFITCRKVSRM